VAKVLYSALISELVGSISGTTFQRNRSGSIARKKPTGLKRFSPKQSIKQTTVGKYVQQWNLLSLSEQLQWDTFADANPKKNIFNQTKILSGFNYFFSINENRNLVGESLLVSPPLYDLPFAVPLYSSYWDNSSMKLFLGSYVPDSDVVFMVLGSQPLKATSTSNRRFYRLISQFDADGITELDIKSDWENYFGIDLLNTTFAKTGISFGLFTIRKSTGLIQPASLQISRFGEGGYSMSKIYKALISQVGTNAPTVDILQNTIGNIVWSRFAQGVYKATLAGIFIEDKTYISLLAFGSDSQTNRFVATRVSDDVINIISFNTATETDDLLIFHSLTIEVF